MSAVALCVAESPTAYARRPRMVIDASVLVAVLFGEDANDSALALMRGRSLVAPWLLDHEIASVAQKKIRREGRSLADVQNVLANFSALHIERHAVPAGDALLLAERYQLTAYDAAYLWLAEKLDAPLATFDARLGMAARRHLADFDPDN